MEKQQEEIRGTEKEFLDIFKTLCYSRSSWQVWADVISAIACSLSNAADRTPERYQAREKEYEECIKRLGSVEAPSKLMAIIVMALERNPEQDFLGKLYMSLELGNHWKGQFFTPYNICRLMSDMTVNQEGMKDQIEKQGYVSVCDPACGAGATLVAAANSFRRLKINYQSQVLFAGQDIDRVVAMMCYIQLSLLGCPGYITIGNSLTNPQTGHILFPEEKDGQELWYTPMFMSDIWIMRRQWCLLEQLCGTVTTEKTVEKGHFYMFFDFDEKENHYGKHEFIR